MRKQDSHMGMILIGIGLIFAFTAGGLAASFGIAFGMLCRSSLKGVIAGSTGLIAGFVAGWYIYFAGLAGNAANGFTWYGWTLESSISAAVVMGLLACAVPLAALLISRVRNGADS